MSDDFFRRKYGAWALVLGAAQGLGEAYAHLLAERGVKVLMVDVQERELERCAAGVSRAHGVETRTLVLDLAGRGAVKRLMESLKEAPDCRLLVYCAAYGPVRMFLDNDAAELDRYIDVNARNLLHLSHAFSRRLIGRGDSGGMIIISSLAGLWGTALVAPYGATKAFGWNLGEALHYELSPFRIDVLSVCSGAMSTPAYLATNPEYGRLRPRVDDPVSVARQSLEKLGKTAFMVSGRHNRLVHFLFSRLLPRPFAVKILNDVMRRMYRAKWRPEKYGG